MSMRARADSPGALLLAPARAQPSAALDARALLLQSYEPPSHAARRFVDPEYEFQLLEAEEMASRRSMRDALLDHNRCKNRYCNVVPYDDTRVVLSGGAGCDYINASFVDGESENSSGAYIATQGPLPHTFADFWRMVWETSAKIIVMLGRERENLRVKVDRYWPSFLDQPEVHGDVQVMLVSESYVSDGYIIRRTMQISRGTETRSVTQYQYSGWPDHGVPKSTQQIRDLMHALVEAHGRRVAAPRRYQLEYSPGQISTSPETMSWPPPMGRSVLPRPVIVHCSAGIGRTGTFCAIHILVDSLQEQCARAPASECCVNLFRTVARLRQQRAGMVQQQEQYAFCYDAVLDEAAALGLVPRCQNPLPQISTPGPQRQGMHRSASDYAVSDRWAQAHLDSALTQNGSCTPPPSSACIPVPGTSPLRETAVAPAMTQETAAAVGNLRTTALPEGWSRTPMSTPPLPFQV